MRPILWVLLMTLAVSVSHGQPPPPVAASPEHGTEGEEVSDRESMAPDEFRSRGCGYRNQPRCRPDRPDRPNCRNCVCRPAGRCNMQEEMFPRFLRVMDTCRLHLASDTRVASASANMWKIKECIRRVSQTMTPMTTRSPFWTDRYYG